MTPEQVLAIPPKILAQRQREAYFDQGFLILERIIPMDIIERMRATTDEMVGQSRRVAKSDAVWDIEPDHRPDRPRLRRLSSPCDHHPEYWNYVSKSLLGDIVADLVGPDVKFHHSKLNFKASGGGQEVKWHQDIQFWPHTNYSPLTVGTYMYDCDMDMGPVGFIPGSHKGPLYNQYDKDDRWIGCLNEEDSKRLDVPKAVYAAGPAGTITIHNCRTLHASAVNRSNRERPLFLCTFASADAFPYTGNPLQSKYDQVLIRGRRARWSHVDPEPCLVPPDWSGGYTSIFALQQREEGKGKPARAYAG